jgi:hypothetical protein
MTGAMHSFLVALNAMLVEQSEEAVRNGRPPFAPIEPPQDGILILTGYHDHTVCDLDTGAIEHEVGIEFKITPDVVEGTVEEIEPLELDSGA